MRKSILRFTLCLLTVLFVQTAVAAGPAVPLKFDFLQLDKDFPSGCGCSVTDAKGRFLMSSDVENQAPAIIKVNGEKLSLKWKSTTEQDKSKTKVGDKFTEVYSDGTTTLKINRVVSKVCAPSDESCEVINYKTSLELNRGTQSVKMEQLNGDCGC